MFPLSLGALISPHVIQDVLSISPEYLEEQTPSIWMVTVEVRKTELQYEEATKDAIS
jgi:hypothetical protein